MRLFPIIGNNSQNHYPKSGTENKDLLYADKKVRKLPHTFNQIQSKLKERMEHINNSKNISNWIFFIKVNIFQKTRRNTAFF